MRNAKFIVKNRPSPTRFDAVEFTPLDELDEEEDLCEEEYEEEEVEEEEDVEEVEEYEEEMIEEEPEEIEEPPAPRRRGRPRKSAAARLDNEMAALLLGANSPSKLEPARMAKSKEPKPIELAPRNPVYSLAEPTAAFSSVSLAGPLKPLPKSVKQQCERRRYRGLRFCFKAIRIAAFTALACWSACGVSIESNLAFWREILQNDWGRLAGVLFEQVHELLGVVFFG